MTFFDLIQQRYSCRGYKSDPVPQDLLNQVLDAIRLAPTAANRQPFRFIVIPTAGREAELRRIYYKPWFVQAPLVICACAVLNEAWVGDNGRCCADIDVAIAMDHFTLAATSVGLGTCWIGAFEPTATREILNLPPGVEPVVFTPFGYPADQPKPKERRLLSELVMYGGWTTVQG